MPPRLALHLLLIGIVALPSCNRNPTPPSVGSAAVDSAGDIMVDLEPVTMSRRMKVTWVQSAKANTADTHASGKDLRLMGLDSANGKGIVPLLPTVGSYFRPLITPDGNQVIYTDRSGEPKMVAIGWESGAVLELGPGVAVATWKEPSLSRQWIYAIEEIDHGAREGLFGKRLVRFTTDHPTEREIVWAQTPIDADGFQLSRDGKRASALLPAPEACRINFLDSTWKKLTAGAWPALAPDDSYLAWALDADNATLTFFQPNQPTPWSVNAQNVAEIGAGNTLWHPRWGNNPSLITFTGPYPLAPNQPKFTAATDGLNAEIFVARLGAGATDLLSVVQITHNDRGDAYPDVWMENSHIETLVNFPQAPEDLVIASNLPWPANPDGLLFAVANAGTDVAIPVAPSPASDDPSVKTQTRVARVIGHQSARFGKDWELDLSRGYFTADAESAAAIGNACKASGAFTVEAIFRESRESYLEPLSVRLASYRLANGQEAFGLYRVENFLVARTRLGTDPATAKVYPSQLANFRIEAERPYHLVVTLDKDVLRTYVDSSQLSEISLEASGLAAWGPGEWQLGDPEPMGENDWTGTVDHTSFYSRALGNEEVQQNFSAIQPLLQGRKAADRVKLKGSLEAVTPLTARVEQSPYARILTSRTYRVVQIEAGIYQPQYIVVLHDAALNRKPIPDLPTKLGETYSLLVEPAAQHLELKAAEVVNQSPMTNLPIYIEVTPPPRLKP
jgi:hypothetical protein